MPHALTNMSLNNKVIREIWKNTFERLHNIVY